MYCYDHQSFIFLHQIKKAQRSELGTVHIDVENKVMKTVIDEGVCTASEQVVINLSKKWKSVDSITDYLQEENLLERIRPGQFFLAHRGYHYIQAIIIDFLFKSILVPIIVALLTTLATLWVKGIL